MTKPSDRAIAQAFLEPGESAWTRGYRQFVMKRAAEIDAAAPDGARAVASVCLVTHRNPPHFAAAEIQLHGGYEPKIGDKLYLSPPSTAPAPLPELTETLIAELREIEGIRGAIGGTQEIGDHYRERCAAFLMLNHDALVAALRASGGAQDAEDAARLDFIELKRFDVCPLEGGGFDVYRYREGSNETVLVASGATAREAIDAARAAGGGG